MIAEEVEAAPESSDVCDCGCCSPASASASLLVRSAGRGAASGLVKGLRGEAPFDGSQLPRLPWNGRMVSETDIQFISDWIDDNCPENDHVIDLITLSGQIQPLGLNEIKSENVEADVQTKLVPSAASANEYKYEHGELKQRMNIDCMTDVQLERLRDAFRELYALNKWPEDSRSYNNMALIHQDHCQHGWERFLPWHRIYLYEFEQALQDHVPDVTMPYWDWTMPQYRPNQPTAGWRIPRAMQAYLTAKSLEERKTEQGPIPPKLLKLLKKLKPLVGKPYYSQHSFFEAVAKLIGDEYTQGLYRESLIDMLLEANALWYPLRYPGEYQDGNGKSVTINQAIHYHYPKPEDIEQILSLRSFHDFGGGSLYNDSFGFIDQNPHNTMHIWTGGMNPDASTNNNVKGAAHHAGLHRNRTVRVANREFHKHKDLYDQPAFGDMFSNLTASYDPIFWPVHANVDRLWWEWQQLHPQSLPADLDAILTPWSYTIADTLDMHQFGYEYVKSTYILPVGLAAPVGRFVSNTINIPETVRTAFRLAEVRLHRVPQLPRSCFIRVFLNLPDANAHTPLDHPGYAGYLAIFGHGACYGGPGHCDIPPARVRPYDRRPRSHNTPRNHRINVTACAKRLLESGATALQITLVVIGADYSEENELLRLEGVSLNFLD
jgi:tyrosinase